MEQKIPVMRILRQQLVNRRFGLWCGLGIVLFILALWVTDIKQQYRSSYIELQGLKHQEDNLRIEWIQLLLESGTWSSPGHVNDFANQNLGMTLPDKKHSGVINLPFSLESSQADTGLLGEDSLDAAVQTTSTTTSGV